MSFAICKFFIDLIVVYLHLLFYVRHFVICIKMYWGEKKQFFKAHMKVVFWVLDTVKM